MVFQEYALLPWKTTAGQHRVRAAAQGHAQGRARGDHPALRRAGRAQGLREEVSAPALGRHAPARRRRARAGQQSDRAADGRAVRRRRRHDAPAPAGGARRHHRARAHHRAVHHPRHRGGRVPVRPRGRPVGTARPHRRRPHASTCRARAAGTRVVRDARFIAYRDELTRCIHAAVPEGTHEHRHTSPVPHATAHLADELLPFVVGIADLAGAVVGRTSGRRCCSPRRSRCCRRSSPTSPSGVLLVNLWVSLQQPAAGLRRRLRHRRAARLPDGAEPGEPQLLRSAGQPAAGDPRPRLDSLRHPVVRAGPGRGHLHHRDVGVLPGAAQSPDRHPHGAAGADRGRADAGRRPGRRHPPRDLPGDPAQPDDRHPPRHRLRLPLAGRRRDDRQHRRPGLRDLQRPAVFPVVAHRRRHADHRHRLAGHGPADPAADRAAHDHAVGPWSARAWSQPSGRAKLPRESGVR